VTTGPAEVFDLGYRPYEGERTSRWRRRQAIWRDGIRISLGLGRGAGAKIAPWLLISFALIPVAVLIVLASFASSFGDEGAEELDLPSYAEYYEFAVLPIALFAAIVAPLLICPDRRDSVLSLYAARPITPPDYVAARWAAFLTVATVAAVAPEVILFAWNALDAAETGTFLREDWDVVPRFAASGAMVAVVLTTLSLVCASFTTRRAYATVTTLAVLFVGSAVSGIAEDNFSGTVSDVFTLLGLPQVLMDTVDWIFGEDVSQRPLSGGVRALWLAGFTAALGLLLVRRMDRIVRA
jgi:ABC-2 type transport system permease protein